MYPHTHIRFCIGDRDMDEIADTIARRLMDNGARRAFRRPPAPDSSVWQLDESNNWLLRGFAGHVPFMELSHRDHVTTRRLADAMYTLIVYHCGLEPWNPCSPRLSATIRFERVEQPSALYRLLKSPHSASHVFGDSTLHLHGTISTIHSMLGVVVTPLSPRVPAPDVVQDRRELLVHPISEHAREKWAPHGITSVSARCLAD